MMAVPHQASSVLIKRSGPKPRNMPEAAPPPSAPSPFDHLDRDCLFTILCSISGPPPEQARTLAQIATTCSMLGSVAEEAATALLELHMQLAQCELAELQRRYALWAASSAGTVVPSTLELTINGSATSSAIEALWHDAPMLPLQWNVLNHAITNKSNSSAGIAAWMSELGLCAADDDGILRLSWMPTNESDHARELRFDGGNGHATPFAAYLLAHSLGLSNHPGLIARHRVATRRAALCPCCRR